MTLFPETMESVLGTSIIGRARDAGLVNIECVNIRDFSKDKHRKTDDAPFGGGYGMIMTCQPIYDCYKYLKEKMEKQSASGVHTVYMSPQGKTFDQNKAKELSGVENLIILCGHYEGVDERIIELIVDEEISIGDLVLTGGEIPAMAVTDAVVRLLPGVLRAEECYTDESHQNGLLEYPQYTRPRCFEGLEVPEVLISGHAANIEKWKQEQAVKRTREKRPDLLDNKGKTDDDGDGN